MLIEGINYAADHGADVINMSVGDKIESPAMNEACSQAAAKGAILIAASGNTGDSSLCYPAAYSSVVSVGSIESDGAHSDFSTYNKYVEAAAPGRGICMPYILNNNTTYARVTGTSYSAAQVAAMAAMVKSMDKSVTCKFNYLFKDYGVFTMEVQVDKPDYNAGNLTYHVFGEADFAPDASVTFTVKHDHEFRFSDPTWEENYTVDQEPTCTKAGAESIHCSVCGESKPDSVREIPALGHNWKKITYTWSQDYKKVTATAVCKNNADHTLLETVKTKAATTPATIKKEGKTVYTATFKKEAFSEQKKTVKLPKLVAVKTVKLNKTKATLAVGKKLQLKVKAITPKNAAIKTVKWTSSNKKVATVDKNGKVTARSAGTCKITCTATDGSKKKATVTITVE